MKTSSLRSVPTDLRVMARARPPRLDMAKPDFEMAAPPSPDALDKWNPGIRAANSDADNVITIFDIIGEDFWTGGGVTANRISAALRKIGNREVEVQINSPGGDMFEGIAIYNLLQQHPAKVTVKVMGLAASAASLIAMAGDTIMMGQASFLMIHNCWVMAIGNRHDMLEVAEYLEPFDAAMRDLYAARTGQDAKTIEGMLDAETYIGQQKAIDLGFADAALDGQEVTEDKDQTEKARAANALRKVEAVLTRKGGMSRSAARSLITEMKAGKPGAAPDMSGKPGAAESATHDAGGSSWITDAKALIQRMKASA